MEVPKLEDPSKNVGISNHPKFPHPPGCPLKKPWEVERTTTFFVGLGIATSPRDSGSPSENGFMEPKYYAFR